MSKKFTVWLTGLSASGKTTIAKILEEKLSSLNVKIHHLDGDEVRSATTEKFGFDNIGRDKNIKLAISIAKEYQNNGYNVIASFISPYRHHREWGRYELENYIEVFVNTPLDTCEIRDPKGLYKEARAGKRALFTGIDDPYEEPKNPDIEIKTCDLSAQEGAEKIIAYLKDKKLI